MPNFTITEEYLKTERGSVSYTINAKNKTEALYKFETNDYHRTYNKLGEDIQEEDYNITDVTVTEDTV